MEKYSYTIGDKTYCQNKLVLGQVRQIVKLLEGVEIKKDADSLALIKMLDDKLPDALAIVLTESGTSLKNKDIKALAEELEFSVDLDMAVQVIEDFFSCNPIASLIEKLTGTLSKIQPVGNIPTPTGFLKSSSFLPEETSQNETPSSGDLASKSASHILSTAEKK